MLYKFSPLSLVLATACATSSPQQRGAAATDADARLAEAQREFDAASAATVAAIEATKTYEQRWKTIKAERNDYINAVRDASYALAEPDDRQDSRHHDPR